MTDPTPPNPTPPPPHVPAPPAYVPPPQGYVPPPPDYVPPGPTQYAPTVDVPAPSGRGQWIRVALLIAIAAAIGIGFLVFRDRVSNDVASLQPGECFDEPAEQSEISDVQRQPCNEPHDAEVFANVRHDAEGGASYPVSLEFGDLADDECVPQLLTYTGLTTQQLDERGVFYGYFYPGREGWGSGDRVVTCYLTKTDRSKMTSPLRGAGSATPTP